MVREGREGCERHENEVGAEKLREEGAGDDREGEKKKIARHGRKKHRQKGVAMAVQKCVQKEEEERRDR